MICIDLMYEWLWDVRGRIGKVDYIIDLVTFMLIQILGIEYGILVAVVIYALCYRLGCDVGCDDCTSDSDE